MAISTIYLGCTLLLCLAVLSEGHEARMPLHSAKTPGATIMNYTVVTPTVTYRSSQEEYPEQLHFLIITGEGLSSTLQLKRNDFLMSAGFTSRHYTHDGEVVEEEGHKSCFYQGHVLEQPGWTVTMSTCRGLRGSFGDWDNREKFYHLEPLKQEGPSLEQPHALYLDTELKQRTGRCGTAAPHVHSGVNDIVIPQEGSPSAGAGRGLRQSNGVYVMEWTIYNDNAQFRAHGSDVGATKLRAMEVANVVDTRFNDLRIRIALVSVVTWSNRDQIVTDTNPETFLRAFVTYLATQPDLSDSTMLLTGVQFSGLVVGVANFRSMCSGNTASGITHDGGSTTEQAAATAAHEVGHIFNMDHDNTADCNCADGVSGCIMAAETVANMPPTMWSQCSRNQLNEGFQIYNLNRCLSKEPGAGGGSMTTANRGANTVGVTGAIFWALVLGAECNRIAVDSF